MSCVVIYNMLKFPFDPLCQIPFDPCLHVNVFVINAFISYAALGTSFTFHVKEFCFILSLHEHSVIFVCWV